jgi:hypothetical protein
MCFVFKKSTDGLKFASWFAVAGSLIFIVTVVIAFCMSIGDINWNSIGWFWTKNGVIFFFEKNKIWNRETSSC